MLVNGKASHSFAPPCLGRTHLPCSHCRRVAGPFPISQASTPHTADEEMHSASGSEAEDVMPPHHPAPGMLIKLASVAMFHLTSPKEFTFLLTSPPLPLFLESLSLQERKALSDRAACSAQM